MEPRVEPVRTVQARAQRQADSEPPAGSDTALPLVRLPNMEELELYFSFIREVSIPTIIYDGNHEATKKNRTFFSQLKQVSRDINPLVHVVDISYIDPGLGYGILPYADLHRKESIEKFNTKKPLFTHVRGEIPPHVKPEVNLDRFEDFPVVFA